MRPTLLQKAYQERKRVVTRKFKYSDEQIELAVAYLTGKINLATFARTYGRKGNGSAIYGVVTRCLRLAYAKGIINIDPYANR